MTRLILASRSPARIALLRAAGLDIHVAAADVDERAVEAPLVAAGAQPGHVARRLAAAKALAVAADHPDAVVIGADQTLGLGSRLFTKAADRDAARRTLAALAGETHTLYAAVAIARAGVVVWDHVGVARLTMRPLDDAAIERHLDREGPEVFGSVGCYRLEGAGIQLFQAVEGDYFTILGLPMLPLLAHLRDQGLIEP